MKEDASEQELLMYIKKAEENTKEFSHYTPEEVMKELFDYKEYKPRQEEIITRILTKQGHTLGIMPTGGGKSLCFQIPALILPNMTLVVSPLIALMKDQVDNLRKKGISSAFYLNSTMSENAKKKTLELVKKKKVKILYIAPESLKSEKIIQVISDVKIDLFVIDEAHCISSWGNDFRPDYLRISTMISLFQNPLVLALTATATQEVERDIQKQLGLECAVFKSSFDRPQLYIQVITLQEDVDKEAFLSALLKKLSGPTIVYVTFTETAENLEQLLQKKGFACTYYHGQIREQNEKEKRQNTFISDECEIIISTIAFGMGIDKANIRNIIHFNCSHSIENYYQEIGRAGRDEQKANCITLYSSSDRARIKRLKEKDWPNKEKIQNVLSYIKNKNTSFMFSTAKSIAYECDIHETPVALILQRLEESAAIKIYARVPAQIQIVKPLKMSYEEIIQAFPQYHEDLQKIFSSSFFRNTRREWLVFEELMQETGSNYFRLKEILFYLIDQGYIEKKNETTKDLIVRNEKIHDFDISPIVFLFQSLLERNLQKLDLVAHCLLGDSCIRKSLLLYFGENYEKENCGMCSYCVSDTPTNNILLEKQEEYLSEEEREIISRTLQLDAEKEPLEICLLKCLLLDQTVPKKDFVNIVTGDLKKRNSEWKFELQSYNKLYAYKERKLELEKSLSILLDQKDVKRKIDGTLQVTKKGLRMLESWNVKKA